MPGLDELSNEEVDRIAITEVLGYSDGLEIGANYPDCWYPPDCTDPIRKSKMHPTSCRNQSRLVVEAARLKSSPDFQLMQILAPDGGLSCIAMFRLAMFATPRQEVIAAILAVRDIAGVRDLP